jgi:predicted aspartyl protease
MAASLWPTPLLAAVATLLAASPLPGAGRAAAAEHCVPVRKAAIALIPGRSAPFVPLTINGDRAVLLLDTGAEQTLLSAAAAKRLGLAAHYTYPHTMQGVGGGLNVGEVRLDAITVGGLSMPGFLMPVANLTLPGVDGQPIDGLLGGDVLGDFDLDIDMSHNQVTLYQPIACDTPALPGWQHYVAVEAHRSMHRHLFFAAQLDGHALTAIIDTGAQRSAIDVAAAAQAGATEAALRQDPTVTVNGMAASVKGSHFHRFGRLEIGTLNWANPVVIVTPLHLDDADVILGADFLATHRVWLSYAAHRVFIAPAR